MGIAIGTRTADHSSLTEPNAIRKTLPRTAKPAALGPTDINAVMDVGAPSYASGAHIWKGTAAILNEKATAKNIIDSISTGLPESPLATMYADIAFRSVVPVRPYIMEVP